MNDAVSIFGASQRGCVDKCCVICHASAAQQKRNTVVCLRCSHDLCFAQEWDVFTGLIVGDMVRKTVWISAPLFSLNNNLLSSCFTNSVFFRTPRSPCENSFHRGLIRRGWRLSRCSKWVSHQKISWQTLQTLRRCSDLCSVDSLYKDFFSFRPPFLCYISLCFLTTQTSGSRSHAVPAANRKSLLLLPRRSLSFSRWAVNHQPNSGTWIYYCIINLQIKTSLDDLNAASHISLSLLGVGGSGFKTG